MVSDEELMDLVGEAAEAPPQEAPVQGPCQVCKADDTRDARYRCVRCDTLACPGHYWVMLGLCHRCATETDVNAVREERRRHPRRYLDIKWVED